MDSKLTSEIFSLLENNFLFGEINSVNNVAGKVRILSIDGGGATDGVLAAKSLVHLESSLRRQSGNPNARIADFFDVVAGSGAGGVLAALLFTRDNNCRPMFTAAEALSFITENRANFSSSSKQGILRRILRFPAKGGKLFGRTFGELTLKDTLKAVLIPCYDLTTGAPFVFSRADAMEMDGCDFKMSDVCAATTVVGDPISTASVDQKTKIAAVGGEVAMNNPTAAAITHVLNNKHEFPFCNGVQDLLVLSLGNGEPLWATNANRTPSRTVFAKIVGDAVSDTVDQAVSMAFGGFRTTNYTRIQATKYLFKTEKESKYADVLIMAEEMLAQMNMESVLFREKKRTCTNMNKLECFACEIMKENKRRETDILPRVLLKQITTLSSPRTSSDTSLSIISSY